MVFEIHSQTIVDVIDIQNEQGLNEREISHVSRDRNGYFYFISNHSIQKFDGSTFREIPTDAFYQNGYNISDIESIQILKDGSTKLVHPQTDFIIDHEELTIIAKPANGSQALSVVQTLRHEKDESLHFDCVQRAGKSLSFEGNKIYNIQGGEKRLLDELSIGDASLNFVTNDKKGNIIACYNSIPRFIDFVFVIDMNDKVHDFSNLVSTYSTFKTIYADDVFYRIVLAGYNGVKILSLKRPGTDFFAWDKALEKGQFGRVISGIAFDGDEIVCSSESKYYYRIGDNSDDVKLNEKIRKKMSSVGVGQMRFDSLNQVFYQIGYNYTGQTDFYKIDIDKEQVSHFVIPFKHSDFYIQGKDTIVFVGEDRGLKKGVLLRYDLAAKKPIQSASFNRGLNTIYFHESAQTFWVGSEDEVFLFDVNLKQTNSIEDKQFGVIASIQQYLDHLVICSRNKGVVLVNPKSLNILKTISTKDDLTSDQAIGSLEDDSNRCWISTFNGLNVIDSTLQVVRRIYDFEGLPNKEFNTRVTAKDRSGNLYFGTINGLVKIHPETVLEWEESYQAVVHSVSIYKGDYESTMVPIDNNLKIESNVDSVAFNVSFNDFHKYSYTNYDADLNCDDSNIQVRKKGDSFVVNKLDSGDYGFSLKRPNQSSEIEYKLNVVSNYEVLTQLLILLLSGIFILSLFIFLAYKNRQRLDRQRLAHEKKFAELQLSALQAQMNPHFIFNALGAIQYFIQTNNNESADDYLSDFAFLMRGILEVSRKKYVPLKEEIKLLKLYLHLQQLRFENKFDVRFDIDEKVDQLRKVPPLMLQPLIENAIDHGLHHLKSRRGKLVISINQIDQNNLTIEIFDNGIGRAASSLLRNKNHVSRATQILEDRIRTINRTQYVQIKFKISDLFDADNESAGTKIFLELFFNE